MPDVMHDRRSLLNFAILVVVAAATAGFVVNKASEAIAEIDALNIYPPFSGRQKAAIDTSAGSTALTANPAPSNVEGWKTYRNEKYGFEVRYPPINVTSENLYKEERGIFHINFYNPGRMPLEAPSFFIRVFENGKGLPLDTWAEKYPESYNYEAVTPYSKKELVTVSGVNGLLIGDPLDAVPRRVILLPRGRLLFILGFYDFYDQILPTFKFTPLQPDAL
ncbi:MAG: hypothetical protein HY454_04045 [Parcubacteria group bacterium]|nr:hypothetical protein [Parcubacteria group bacterium]